MSTFLEIALVIICCALGGLIGGFIVNYLTWWGKDLRDSHLKSRGFPPLKDRVFPRYQWGFLVLGIIIGVAMSLFNGVSIENSLIGLPLFFIFLANVLIPMFFLPVLMISTIEVFINTPSPPNQTYKR